MQVTWATEAVPGRDWPNEDFVASVPSAVVLLDGCSLPPGTDLGCSHGTAWYSRTLGLTLVRRMLDDTGPLSDRGAALRALLAASIDEVASLHAHSCDLTHPATPAATVVALRQRGAQRGPVVEYLVLADSTLLLDTGGSLEVVTKSMARTYAAADSRAAERALTGALPATSLRRAALLTDGATRLAEKFRVMGWQDLMGILDKEGPVELIRRTREAENSDPDGQRWPRHKRHDDAAAVICVF